MRLAARFASLRRLAFALLALDAVAVAIVASPGCGPADRAPAPREIPVDLPALLAEAACQRAAACCVGVDAPFDKARCPAQIARDLGGQWDEVRRAYVAGEVDLHPAKVGACVDAIRGLECPGSLRDLFPRGLTGHAVGDCADVIAPRADGGCTIDVACADGGVCADGRCAPASGCDGGACAPPKPDGEICTRDDECASAHCQSSAYTCGPPLGVGEHCTRDEDCEVGYCDKTYACALPGPLDAPCESDLWCMNGLYCKYVAGKGNRCAQPIADGGACEGEYALECATGYCDYLTSTCGVEHADGQPCVSGADCLSGICGLKMICTTGSLGSPCKSDDQCASDRCDLVAKKCAKPLLKGASCQQDHQCASGVCLFWKCAEPAREGDDCMDDWDCGDDLYCPHRTCVPLRADGEPCGDGTVEPGDECLHGVCRFGAGEARCAPRPRCQSW